MFYKRHTFKLGIMIGLVFAYFLVELIVGNLVNSVALVADSFHMLSDFIALFVGIAARRIGKWPKSKKNTFGWQRAEVVGTLTNTIMLATLTFTIFIEAIQRFLSPEAVEDPQLLFYVGLGGLLINVVGLFVLGGHGHSHGGSDSAKEAEGHSHDEIELVENHGHSHSKNIKDSGESHTHGHSHSGNMNIRAVFLHVLADFFGSVAVVASALCMWFGPAGAWKNYIDPSISLVMVVLISISTLPLLKQSIMILMQSVPAEVNVSELEEEILTLDGIDTVHDLHVWRLQNDVIIGSVHVVCSQENYIDVVKSVKKLFHEKKIHCTTIQGEFEEHKEWVNRDNGEDVCNNVDKSDDSGCRVRCKSTNDCEAEKSCCPQRKAKSTEIEFENKGEIVNELKEEETEMKKEEFVTIKLK